VLTALIEMDGPTRGGEMDCGREACDAAANDDDGWTRLHEKKIRKMQFSSEIPSTKS
jgi:hypothetical protein